MECLVWWGVDVLMKFFKKSKERQKSRVKGSKVPIFMILGIGMLLLLMSHSFIMWNVRG